MKNTEPESRAIRFRYSQWQKLKECSANLAAERGLKKVSLPAYIAEASKFFEDNRKRNNIIDNE